MATLIEDVRSATRAAAPWHVEQVVRASLGCIAGAAMVAISGAQARNQEVTQRALDWLLLGVAGLGLAAAAGAWFVLQGLRAVAVARAITLRELQLMSATEGLEIGSDARVEATLILATVADGATQRAHVDGCPLVASKSVCQIAPADASELLRCGVCGT